MANYICKTRTNYFRVKDPDEFRTFMSGVHGTEDKIELWEEKDHKGDPIFGFGTMGGIWGWSEQTGTMNDDDVDDDAAYEAFIFGLQQHIANDDAIIILEAGNEKLNYVTGSALIITSQVTRYFCISDIAKAKAAELLHNPQWTTKCDY